MLLLTADKCAQDWADLVQELDSELDSDWVNSNLMCDGENGLRETYLVSSG